MSRELQHVAALDDIKAAKRLGDKVTVLCGKRVYPMTEMDESIPTCTPCHRAERNAWRELLLRQKSYTVTWSGAPRTWGSTA